MFGHFTPPEQHYEQVCAIPLAQIIRIPPAGQKDPPYKNLICTEEDKALIFEVISTVSEGSVFDLLMKQNHLRQIQAQIVHVHPLKFLETIFSNPRLKMGMKNVFDNYFKKDGFMEGLGPRLTCEATKNKLFQYLDDFAKEVNVDGNRFKELYPSWSGSNWTNREWEKLVWFLIEHD